MTIEVHRFPSPLGSFLRLLAHFDALDGDDDPFTALPRYELLHPGDYFEMPDFAAAYYERLCREMMYGPAV